MTLSFLTIRVQTAVNAAAGALRMPLRRYLPAVAAGALVWATIYATVGFVVLEAWFGRVPLPCVAGALVVVLSVVVSTTPVRRRRGTDSAHRRDGA